MSQTGIVVQQGLFVGTPDGLTSEEKKVAANARDLSPYWFSLSLHA